MTESSNLSNSTVSREDIELYFAAYLGRPPESEDTIAYFMKCADKIELARALVGSAEFGLRTGIRVAPSEDQIFRGYVDNDLGVFGQFPAYQGAGARGFATNFLGGRFRTKFQAPLAPFDGVVEGYPIPTGGLQGETAEYIGALRSVLEAKNVYRILECGAGYGPWMGITAIAARLKNVSSLRLYGIEGDAEHVEFMREHMDDVGVAADEREIIHGAVGARTGVARWALVDDASAVYGGRPLENTDVDYLGDKQSRTVEIQVFGINDLLRREPNWDLVHIDIQGGEGAVCEAGIEVMTERVRRVIIGTHSRALDGEVMSTFEKARWFLENEKPTVMAWRPNAATLESMTRVDGAQVWRNPFLG